MWKTKDCIVLAVTLVFSLVNLYLGRLTCSGLLTAGGAIGVYYVLLRIACRGRRKREGGRGKAEIPLPPSPIRLPPSALPHPPAPRKPVDPNDTDALVEEMLAQGRFALLLRPQIARNLGETHFCQAIEALEQTMALVPDGEVVLGRIDEALDDGKLDEEEIARHQGRVTRVERFFLDRFPVTNQQFYEFVTAGGYQQMALWDESILPAVLDLVDRTGMPGPEYWRNGCFPPRQENHPVVGVCWYEAAAFARWIGKRLPSDAEWVKAGSWPVPLSATTRSQRKYPWGDTMDRSRANLWGSGPERIVPVEEFADGVSVGGVYQLIGNVWEWTGGNFRSADYPMGELVLRTPMKSIRGGAFDTYFDNQATCGFQTGENPLNRRHNIGFRLAVGVCDLVLTQPAPKAEGGRRKPEEESAALPLSPSAFRLPPEEVLT